MSSFRACPAFGTFTLNNNSNTSREESLCMYLQIKQHNLNRQNHYFLTNDS